MTKQSEIIDDPKYIPILDHGFVGLVDSLGNDQSITRAARVSYGAGTKKVSEDRALIRYLMRNYHSSPTEMVEFVFHAKIPIFIMRQLVRHRTANLNEYSGRYSVMSDEFYLPASEQIKPQSADNKQGRGGEVDELSKRGVGWLMRTSYEHSYMTYKVLLGDRDGAEDAYDDNDPLLSDDFAGVARELARAVLPVANYTEAYWKIDLSNLFKFLKLRQDAHAQYEIRVFADAVFQLIQPIVPLACEAYIDYMQQAITLSRMEHNLLRDLLSAAPVKEIDGAAYGLTKRELQEFTARLGLG